MLDLSIIILNRNHAKLLEECLFSIYQTTHKIGFEIIVVDNGSTDDSLNMVKARFPGVKVIANHENLGFAQANNQGLALALGRYCLLLNNDTVVKEGAFDKLVEFMDQHPEAGICGPKLLNSNGSIQKQGGLLGPRFWKSPRPVEVNFVIGACLMIRKEALEQAGTLDENLYFYNEDLDLCLNTRKSGYKVMFVPEAEVIHYGGASSKHAFNKKLFVEGFKGSLYFCKKHYGLWALFLYRLFLLLGLLVTLPFYLFVPKRAYWQKLSAYIEVFFLVTEIKIW